MLNILSDKANANQNNTEFISSQSEWLSSRKQTLINVDKFAAGGLGGRNPYTLLVEMIINAAVVEISMEVPQKTNIKTTI
jgi:hypothetical protein